MLSPHAALDGEWDVVVIAGCRKGCGPTPFRAAACSAPAARDVLDGVGRRTATGSPLLAEERRLLIAAMGRARTRLLVTAVDSEYSDDSMLPSPFCHELAGWPPTPRPMPPHR